MRAIAPAQLDQASPTPLYLQLAELIRGFMR